MTGASSRARRSAGRRCAARASRRQRPTAGSPTRARTAASRRCPMAYSILFKQCGSDHMTRGRSRDRPHRGALHRHPGVRAQQRDVLRAQRGPGCERALLRRRHHARDLPERGGGRHRLARRRLADELPLDRHRGRLRRRGLQRDGGREAGLAREEAHGQVRHRRLRRHPPLRRDGQALPRALRGGVQVGGAEGRDHGRGGVRRDD